MNHDLAAYICVIYNVIFMQYIVTLVVEFSYLKIDLGCTLLMELTT